MTKELILLPIILLVLLTIIVWFRMLVLRVTAMKTVRIHPEKMKSQKAKELMPEAVNIASENFANLFEVPVVFYLLSLLVFVTDSVSGFYLITAISYVSLRYAHSFIALTYNRVMHRFSVYVLSCLVLWVMWGVFLFQTVSSLL